jgi:hypothetical protein
VWTGVVEAGLGRFQSCESGDGGRSLFSFRNSDRERVRRDPDIGLRYIL